MALKEDGVNFVLCPKQGNKIEGFSQTGYVLKEFFFLNRFRVSNPQRLTSTQILVEWSGTPHPPFPTARSFALRNRVEITILVCEEKHCPVFARAQKLLWCEHILKFISIAFDLVFFNLKCWITTHGILTCSGGSKMAAAERYVTKLLVIL